MPFRRRLPKRQAPIANVIVVEGKIREQRYFDQVIAASLDPGTWTVVSSNAGDPKSLLAKALEYLESELDNPDRVFVVFDGDRLPPNCSENEAKSWLRLLRLPESDERVRLIQSSPSFEVWLLWHFEEKLPAVPQPGSKPYAAMSEPFKRRLAQFMPRLDRDPAADWRHLRVNLSDACSRAKKARANRERTKKPTPTAFSDVDLLIREMGLD